MFKKLNLILMSALALGFTACDDIEDIDPQAYAQEPLMSLEGLTVSTGTAISGETVNLNISDKLDVIKTIATPELKEGQTVEYIMHFASSESFSDSKTLTVNSDGGSNYVFASDVNTIFRELLGKTDKARDFHVRFAAYFVYGDGARVRVGEKDTYFATSVMSVIPYTPEIFIDETYYLMVNGEKRAEFKNTGGDVYDNPTFKANAKVDLNVDMDYETFLCPWYIVAKTYAETQDASVARMVFAPELTEATEGKLLTNTGADDIPASGTLILDGSLLFTFNAETLDYVVEPAPNYLYTPGDVNNWDASVSQCLYSGDKIKYEGYAHFNGGFKLTETIDGSGNTYGYSSAGKLTVSTDFAGVENITATDGLYWCNVNVSNLTYNFTPISTIGIIGDFNSWGSSIAMTPSADYLVWKGEVTLTSTHGWKFRANNGWDINLGGSINDLKSNGSNIASPGDGTYEVVLDLSKLPYTATLTKK